MTQLFCRVHDQVLAVVIPPPLRGDGFKVVSSRASNFFRGLQVVSPGQFGPGLVKKLVADRHMGVGNFNPFARLWCCHISPVCCSWKILPPGFPVYWREDRAVSGLVQLARGQ